MRSAAQGLLGAALVFTGTGHLTFARTEFRAQVPPWVPMDVDTVVVLSGVVELTLGGALLVAWRQPWRAVVGIVAAGLFVAVFPGNIAQLTEHRDALGLEHRPRPGDPSLLPAGAHRVGALGDGRGRCPAKGGPARAE
ncbi:DoxX family protein [Janibacter sp. G368]|uniref:DoxX family protein n=1 Tax=Janibacter sp. G368 TaxID=3420441 RepID=UPI003CFED99B